MGGVGVRRLEAGANHSSEKARVRPSRPAEMRSAVMVSVWLSMMVSVRMRVESARV